MRLVLLLAVAAALARPVPSIAQPTPMPHPSQTPPPELAAPSPTPLPLLVNGQVIDIERGYIVFSSGDAFRLAPNAAIVDNVTGEKPRYRVAPGAFAVATLDLVTAQVILVRTAQRPISIGTPAAQIPHQYVAEASTPKPNPDLAPPRGLYASRLSGNTLVTLTVQVPPNTPYGDDVYLATDTSGWNPQAIKLLRIDGAHFRTMLRLAGGTRFAFLFTRGSWATAERDRAGLERSARRLFVNGSDVQTVDATVSRWADLP